jgi:hypothetical protein
LKEENRISIVMAAYCPHPVEMFLTRNRTVMHICETNNFDSQKKEKMKTLTINSLEWVKAFFTAANPLTNARPTVYKSRTTDNNKAVLNDENKSTNEKPGAALGDIMRTAHRGNFSSGPTFLFHPGWFK